MMKAFPVAEVERITGTLSPDASGAEGDTYVPFPEEGLTWEQLNELVQVGGADPENAQNDSPTIGEFLDEVAHLGGRIRFIGYIIYPPRSDCRVSVEGFEGFGLTADEALDLAARYRADEFDKARQPDGTYDVRFWWD
jgi:hypothetical protein